MADFSTVARPYAKAVFEIATQAGELAAWSEALGNAALLVSDAAARRHLARPDLRSAERAAFLRSVLEAVPGGGIFASATGKNLLALLSENQRLQALPEIAAEFDRLKARAENKVKVTLVSATEVDAAQADKVAAALQRKLGRSVELEIEINPSLLGGAVVRADDMVIDGSVRSRLQRLAGSLSG